MPKKPKRTAQAPEGGEGREPAPKPEPTIDEPQQPTGSFHFKSRKK